MRGRSKYIDSSSDTKICGQLGQLGSSMEFPFIYIFFFSSSPFSCLSMGPSVVREMLNFCILHTHAHDTLQSGRLLHSISATLIFRSYCHFCFSKRCSKIDFIRPNPMKKNSDALKFTYSIWAVSCTVKNALPAVILIE